MNQLSTTVIAEQHRASLICEAAQHRLVRQARRSARRRFRFSAR